MKKATEKVAKRIAGLLKGIDRKPPAEQLATYLAVGEKLRGMLESEAEYGSTAMADVAACVPHLGTEQYAYRVLRFSDLDDEVREFVLKETATPMDNGTSLTLGHWYWLFCHRPDGSEPERVAWLHRELAWLRKESPSTAVLEHVEAILGTKYQREVDEIRESAREAIGVLEMI